MCLRCLQPPYTPKKFIPLARRILDGERDIAVNYDVREYFLGILRRVFGKDMRMEDPSREELLVLLDILELAEE